MIEAKPTKSDMAIDPHDYLSETNWSSPGERALARRCIATKRERDVWRELAEARLPFSDAGERSPDEEFTRTEWDRLIAARAAVAALEGKDNG